MQRGQTPCSSPTSVPARLYKSRLWLASPAPAKLQPELCSALPRRLMISQHPEVEAKVLAELDVLELLVTRARPQPRAMTYEDTGKLVYTTWAVKVRSAGAVASEA